MSKDKVVATVSIESFCHATEDCDKVKHAILSLVNSEYRKVVDFIEIPLSGHHKNPIILIRSRIKDKKIAQKTVEFIFSNLDNIDKKVILDTLDLRTDSSFNLYLRFNKQQAYLGKLRLHQGDDVIKVKISFLPHIRRKHSFMHVLEILGLRV